MRIVGSSWCIGLLGVAAACASTTPDSTPAPEPTGSEEVSPPNDADAGTRPRDAESAPDADEPVITTDASSGESDAAVDPDADSVPADAPWLVQCFEGAGEARITKLDTYCSSLTERILPECASDTPESCEGSWAYTKKTQAYAALLAALDTNGDGSVDDADTPQRLALIGHSWGGTNLADVAAQLASEPRVSPSRRFVHLALTFDAFRPLYELKGSPNMKQLWVLRQSAPVNDSCSPGVGGLRYRGLVPRCAAGQVCRDFDYSRSPDVAFPTQAGGSYLGGEIGHCRVPDVGFPIAGALLRGTALPPLPLEVPIAPL